MNEANYSEVSEFIFLGLSIHRTTQYFLFAFSTISYATIFLGNLSVVLTVIFDPHLRSPTYFLLANLSFVGLCFSTSTVPKLISDLYSSHNTISFQGCILQMSILHVVGGCEMVLLIAMAWDRYVSICKPLYHLTTMSPQTCLVLLTGAWIIGLIHSVAQLVFVIHLPFCGSNVIDGFYCDLPRFIKLTCIDTYKMEFLVTADSGLISVTPFFLLTISYIFILFTVWKQSLGSLSKALSTLSAHIFVVVLFFGPCIFVYLWPFPTVPVDKFLATLDIYTLRNKDMKVAMKKLSKQS
ncbi:olfactory receptor 4F15-like [Mesocricetus auratus]|uniref:Olfactory receptor n=1 Tax=Mesocricetus auratus TaxID=10036 RepID=A0A1U7Q5B1_MESAU|nr:olfactory receptor 4F15-like [Mesocricetus auratus]